MNFPSLKNGGGMILWVAARGVKCVCADEDTPGFCDIRLRLCLQDAGYGCGWLVGSIAAWFLYQYSHAETGAVCLRRSTFIHSTVHFLRLSRQATRGKSSWRLTGSADRFPMTAEVLRRVESVGDGEFRQTGQEPLMIHTHTTSECVITCPHCRTAKVEVMPADACIFFYECSGCGALLKRKPGSCCVFCSYGSVPCPPVQEARACEKDMRSSLYA